LIFHETRRGPRDHKFKKFVKRKKDRKKKKKKVHSYFLFCSKKNTHWDGATSDYCTLAASPKPRFSFQVKLHKVYDLKGSTSGRHASPEERRKARPTWKDCDFLLDFPQGEARVSVLDHLDVTLNAAHQLPILDTFVLQF
jgi:hypothetical protein